MSVASSSRRLGREQGLLVLCSPMDTGGMSRHKCILARAKGRQIGGDEDERFFYFFTLLSLSQRLHNCLPPFPCRKFSFSILFLSVHWLLLWYTFELTL